MDPTHLDVVIVGAGLSGIAAAYHLQTSCPGKTYAILEAREVLGGTWDLFRYPGVRSDSDMFTLGYAFRPWTDAKAIADGPSILQYIRDTAEQFGIDRHIRYQRRVERAAWSSEDARWHLDVRDVATGELGQITCGFLSMCSGYYDYEAGYTPAFPGRDRFKGRVVHPQHWPEDLDYTGQRIVVIGSGATAVTLVPELAKKAAHVTMLQRSPSYVMSVPSRDPIADWLRAKLPERAAHAAARWKNVLLGMATFQFSRRFPRQAARYLIKQADKHLDGKVDVAPHFTPTYDVWDQRLCLVPDADLFEALKSDRASIVTDHIKSFTETGIALDSGTELAADLIVTATGFHLKLFGGIACEVDGVALDPTAHLVFKGLMLSEVPNLVFSVGYTNASWTLKTDLTAQYMCRLLNYMEAHGHAWCRPRRDPSVKAEPILDFSSGYVQRALDRVPSQGDVRPWKLFQNYVLDLATIRHARLDEPAMEFGPR